MCDNFLYIYVHIQSIHKPKLILKPDFSFCMAIDKTCQLTPSPTAASPEDERLIQMSTSNHIIYNIQEKLGYCATHLRFNNNKRNKFCLPWIK